MGKWANQKVKETLSFWQMDANTIRKKVMRAVTDAGPTEMNQQKPEAIENLFTLLNVVSKKENGRLF